MYEDLAEKYAPGNMRRYGWGEKNIHLLMSLYNELAALVPQGVTRVLELGCGGGEFAEVLFQRRPELAYIGVDITPVFIEHARARMEVADAPLDGTTGYQFLCCNFWDLLLPSQRNESKAAPADFK